MILTLSRLTRTGKAIFGTLKVDGTAECFTLENSDLYIPAGTYPVTAYFSPHAGHVVPLLQDVPGRDYIEIHCGNLPSDSKGCVLVGRTHTTYTLGNSKTAFAHLLPQIMAAIKRLEPVQIHILDSYTAVG